MSIKDIYEDLRASRKVRSYNAKSDETTLRDDRRSKVHGPYRERMTDFTIEEIKNIISEERIAKKFFGLIGQGKEANIYWIKDFKGRHLALKLFRINTTSHNFQALHTKSKLSDTGKLNIASDLCLKEYENLQVMYEAGVKVPEPVERYEFMYTMEFLGTKRGPSPLLRDYDLDSSNVDAVAIMDQILEDLDKMFNRGQMVHGDFSEHNIVMHNGIPVIIDVLQSQRYHPRFQTAVRIRKREALKVLKKDVHAILDFFKKRVRLSYDPDFVFMEIAGEVEDWSPDELMTEGVDLQSFESEQKRTRLG